MATPITARIQGKLALATIQATGGPVPPPSRRAVSGFPPHVDSVQGLPLTERIRLRILVDWIIDTHTPGAYPVSAITCIGHADRDAQRGAKYELDISTRRAESVLKSLQSDIAYLTRGCFSPTAGFISILSTMKLSATGEGAKYAKPAVTEVQRLRNRRVSIVLARGFPAPPPTLPVSKDQIKTLLIQFLPFRPNYFIDVKYPTKDAWSDLVKAIRRSPLRFFDIKPLAQTVVDALEPPEHDEEMVEKLVEGLTDAIVDDERERRNRTTDPPGDPDEPDDEPIAPPTVYLKPKPIYQVR